LAVAARHLHRLHEFYGAEQGLRIARKHLSWYLEKLPVTSQAALDAGIDLRARRAQFNRLTEASAQLDWVAELEADLTHRVAA
jgi:tRNA-dihydrouridine synthase B